MEVMHSATQNLSMHWIAHGGKCCLEHLQPVDARLRSALVDRLGATLGVTAQL
jgi:hypothetical protein